MNALTIRCIRAAFCYMALGIGLGIWFAIDRTSGPLLRPLHAGLNLWGWTTLFIYGMAYHMLPRFTGRPLSRPRLMAAQSWLAIGSVALVVLGWIALAAALPGAQMLLALGGALQLTGALLFALLIGELLF